MSLGRLDKKLSLLLDYIRSERDAELRMDGFSNHQGEGIDLVEKFELPDFFFRFYLNFKDYVL